MLTLLYMAILIIGLIVAGWSVLGLSRSFAPGTRSQAGASDEVMRMVPIAAGAGAAVFGAVGLVLAQWTDLEPSLSIIWALAAGLSAGFAVQMTLYFGLLRRLVANPAPPEPILGRTAEVVVAIPGQGFGRIAYRNNGQMTQIDASAGTHQPIPKGTLVIIEEIVRQVAKVRPAD